MMRPALGRQFSVGFCFGKTKSNDSVCVPLSYSYDEASTWTTILSWLLFWENKEQQVWEINGTKTQVLGFRC
jgi:hypothetical protein